MNSKFSNVSICSKVLLQQVLFSQIESHITYNYMQLEAAMQLMKRGADRMIVNSSKQPPNQVVYTVCVYLYVI